MGDSHPATDVLTNILAISVALRFVPLFGLSFKLLATEAIAFDITNCLFPVPLGIPVRESFL